MSLKVIVPNGRTEITVNGLHQWDYGRTIEIHAANLPAVVEVHFACQGMETAVVRNCAVVDGATTAAVPDICLEQTSPIVAWVYAIGATSGKTILTIKLPITPRTKPQPGATVPEDIGDKYTETVAAMTALVAECEQLVGDVAGEVEDRIAANLYKEGWTAKYAEQANSASYATLAGKASQDSNGRPLTNSLFSTPDGFKEYTSEGVKPGVLSFRIGSTDDVRIIVEVSGDECHSAVFALTYSGTLTTARLGFEKQTGGYYNVTFETYTKGTGSSADTWLVRNLSANNSPAAYYKHLVEYTTE